MIEPHDGEATPDLSVWEALLDFVIRILEACHAR